MRGAFHRFVCNTLSKCIAAFVLINQKSVYKTINCEWGACHMELFGSCTHKTIWCTMHMWHGWGFQKSNALLSEQIAVGRVNCDATQCAHTINIRRQFNVYHFVCLLRQTHETIDNGHSIWKWNQSRGKKRTKMTTITAAMTKKEEKKKTMRFLSVFQLSFVYLFGNCLVFGHCRYTCTDCVAAQYCSFKWTHTTLQLIDETCLIAQFVCLNSSFVCSFFFFFSRKNSFMTRTDGF